MRLRESNILYIPKQISKNMSIYKKRGLLKHKKATIFEKPIWFLIDLIVSVAVFFMLLAYVDQIGESLTFERDFLSKDIALLIDSMYASPSSLTLKYPQNTFWFSYKFEDNTVEVSERGLLEKKSQSEFIKDKNLGFTEKTISPKKEFEDKRSFIEKYLSPFTIFSVYKPELPEGASVNLYFLKNNKELDINREELILRPDKLVCGNIVTKENSQEKVILIDQGDWDKNDKRPQITAAIAFSIYNNIKDKFKEIKHTRIGNIEDLKKERTARTTIRKNIDNSDIILILQIGNYQDQRNVIKAYYSSKSKDEFKEKSKKLACLIVNSILSNEKLGNIDGISIIESDNSLIEKDKIAVLFEIGNININEEENMVLKVEGINQIARSIEEGLDVYYST